MPSELAIASTAWAHDTRLAPSRRSRCQYRGRDLSSVAHVLSEVAVSARESDAALALGVAAREQGSLREIYDRFGGLVMSVAQKVLRNRTLAEDVVQETFVTFWNAPDGYDPDRGSLKTYLLTIAHRRAVDIVRSEQSRLRREQVPPDRDYSDIESEVISKAGSETVRQALLDLDDNERTAITMAYMGGLTYVEVANRLGTPEGTVKSRIRTGMRKLAANLEGMEL